MIKQNLIIYSIPMLYKILRELQNKINFNIIEISNLKELNNKKFSNSLVITDKNISAKISNVVKIEFPIHLSKLIEKVNVQFIRSKTKEKSKVYIGDYELNLNAKLLKLDSKRIFLTEKETNLITYLDKSKKPVNVNQLQQEVWGYKNETETHTVETHIHRLRKKILNELNKDNSVSGILVQLPLPKHIDKQKIIEAIDPSKDVDGFHPMNVGNLSSGYESSVPCTPLGCYLLIKKIEPNLNGKKAVVVGRSNLNGKPMTQLLLKENCTVTITHSKTKDLKAECLEADIIIAAVGIPELVKGDWVKKDTIVIDVGINKTEKGIVGDVAFDEVSKNAKALTPVPGGVGPMTIACLLKNTIDCFKRSQA